MIFHMGFEISTIGYKITYLIVKITYLSESYCMVCANVREDNPRALASGLSPVHMQNHTITASLHQNAMHVHFVHCDIFDV